MSRDKIRILLLVAEPWRCDDGGGNTLNNFFVGMEAEFAQVYCSAMLPKNNSCHKYFQMTDGMVIRNFFNRRPIGRVIDENIFDRESVDLAVQEDKEKRMMDKFRQIRWQCLIFAKAFVWRYSCWKTEALEKFIKDFNPDVIYAPCYAFPFMLALTRYVKKMTGKKIITWSADDNYSLKQFSLSPFFWINRFWNRHCLRKTYPYYDTFYSISEDEIQEMQKIVGKKMYILRKGIDIEKLPPVREKINFPVRIIYAGGLYINRWKTLAAIGQALKKINSDGVKARLDIYTQSTPDQRQKRLLNDGQNIFLHAAVGSEKLKLLYSESDIAVHCESFQITNRLATRLSFSTKIIDCLSSGCAVMAIAWKHQTGLKYLKKEDAAICVTDIKEIEPVLSKIVSKPELVKKYAIKARQCAVKNHDIHNIQKMLYKEFKRLSQREI